MRTIILFLFFTKLTVLLSTGFVRWTTIEGLGENHHHHTAAAASLYTTVADQELFFQRKVESKHKQVSGNVIGQKKLTPCLKRKNDPTIPTKAKKRDTCPSLYTST